MPFDGLADTTMLTPPRRVSNWRTHDELMHYDRVGATHDGGGNAIGRRYDRAFRSHDGKWYDSTGAFLQGELVRLDPTLYLPLASVSWGRDIDLRSDVTLADEATSWTLTTFGSQGGLGMSNAIQGGKAWIGKNTTQISGVGVDMGLLTKLLHGWSLEIKYTVLELESSLKLGRPIDEQKYMGLRQKHQMDIDAMVYVGDSDTGDTGLVNSPLAAAGLPGAGIITNLPAGTGGTGWGTKLPSEILADFNFALNSVWAMSGWAVVPSRVLLPPTQYGAIATQLVSAAGTTSILRYVEENNILARSGQGKLEIFPCKWCQGAGVGGTLGTPGPGANDRMVVYTKDQNYVRYPMTALAKTPIQYNGIWQATSYYGKLGVLEIVYPETIGYFDRL